MIFLFILAFYTTCILLGLLGAFVATKLTLWLINRKKQQYRRDRLYQGPF